MARNEDLLLGKLAVQQGICNQEQIDECLRLQASSRTPGALGDLLVFKGYLSDSQLKDLLARQHKKLMTCAACRLSFTVVTLTDGKSARCPRCKGPLRETPPGAPTRSDAEFHTRAFKVEPPPAPPKVPAKPKVKVTCVICDHAFAESPDETGRIRCPSCRSSFALGAGR